MLIKNARLAVTQNASRDILEHVDILIEGDRIAAIGKDLKGGPIIDATDKIVMPGLINAHTHNTMTSLRGICDEEELHVWLDNVVGAERAMDDSSKRISSEQGVREMLRTGTTTCCDMYGEIEPTLDAVRRFGMRAVLFKAYFNAFDDTEFEKNAFEALQKKVGDESRVTLGIAPHSVYGCSEKLLKDLRDYSDAHDMLVQIHLSETRKERAECLNEHGGLPLQYLEKLSFLNNRMSLVHGVWLTKGELDICKRHGSSLVHCPASNMKLAGGGVMPLTEAHDRGILCALGTDSTASNNNLDMFEEMKLTALLHKHHKWDPCAAPAQNVLDMATRDAARVFCLDCGSLEVGKKADVVLLDMSEPNLEGTTQENVVSHLVYAACGYNVDTVVVDGVVRVKEKKVL